MSTDQITNEKHTHNTRDRWLELLHEELACREYGMPKTESYSLRPNGAGNSRSITVHPDAATNAPHGVGDTVEELYFPELGIVIVNLNPGD